MEVGFIGLGNIGGPCAKHLLDAGHRVTVFDIRGDAVERIARLGARTARSPAGVAEEAGGVFLSLPTPAAAHEVVTGEGGLLESAHPGHKAIATGIWELSKSPEQFDALRADRSLMPTAVEEIVRWTTPSVYKRRTATRDTVLGGQRIRAGEKVVVWEMSANRDAAVFDAPFEFRIDRAPNNHVGFGHGPHFCLGANLARLEIDVMLNAVLDRWRGIEATGEPTYTRTNRLSGLRTLPVAFTDAGRVNA